MKIPERYIKNIRVGLQKLKENGLIEDFHQREDLYWHVDSYGRNDAVMTDEMAVGFIEGVLSQNRGVIDK